MANNIVFFCKECGYESSKWLGKCPSCNNWNSFVEEKIVKVKNNTFSNNSEIKKLDDIVVDEKSRITTGYAELDRVFGSGIVEGSLTLIGGEPGIGKSTLIMQICNNLANHGEVLYVSGEESESQVKIRCNRLNIYNKNLLFLNETNIIEIENKIEKNKPKFCIIDSIQTMQDVEIASSCGSVSQVKEVTARLLNLAKSKNITIIIIGHVTKDGNIAGPRVLEHMVELYYILKVKDSFLIES
jgi:DNA repair protein RadA/Sms